MEQTATKDMQKCRGCKSRFSHGLTVADDPPVWMWHYCSEECSRIHMKHMFVGLLDMVDRYLDGKHITEEEIADYIKFCRETLGYKYPQHRK